MAMKPGPPPRPTALKRLAGNPGKRQLSQNEPRPPTVEGTPYAPRHLNAEGKREWRRVVKVLQELGLYTTVDRAALAMYCQVWGRWIEAERELAAEGPVLEGEKGGLYQNPWLHVANKAFEQLRRMLAEFGLTPAQRSRVTAQQQAEQLSLAEMLFQDAIGE